MAAPRDWGGWAARLGRPRRGWPAAPRDWPAAPRDWPAAPRMAGCAAELAGCAAELARGVGRLADPALPRTTYRRLNTPVFSTTTG